MDFVPGRLFSFPNSHYTTAFDKMQEVWRNSAMVWDLAQTKRNKPIFCMEKPIVF